MTGYCFFFFLSNVEIKSILNSIEISKVKETAINLIVTILFFVYGKISQFKINFKTLNE